MPWDRSLYPKDWEQTALAIKTAADWQCEQCGKACRKSGESLIDFAQRVSDREDIGAVRTHPQKWTLTVAHLDHDPTNSDPSNLKALCAPCHCRLDVQPSSMARKRKLKRERLGQMTLEFS